MHRRRIAGILLTVMFIGMIAGCGGRPYAELDEAIEARRRGDTKLSSAAINGTYRIGPPDELNIIVQDNPDLSSKAVVRPDGNITFPFSKIHDVYAEGLTPKELADELTEQLSKYIKDVDVTVDVSGFNSQQVFVFGEVRRSMPQAFSGDVSVLDAIGAAGGVTHRSKPSEILVVRGKPDNPQVFEVSIKDITRNGDSSQNIMLQPDDVVYVPPNAFAWVGYQIENIMFPFRGILSSYYQVEIANRDY